MYLNIKFNKLNIDDIGRTCKENKYDVIKDMHAYYMPIIWREHSSFDAQSCQWSYLNGTITIWSGDFVVEIIRI